MSQQSELELKSINDLLLLSFFIPAYQRGYRWSERQVIELLEDIYGFCDRKHPKEDDFYCLQPVVVKQRFDQLGKTQWELVDGQQRLTTILLILGYFNSRFSEDFQKRLYTMEYETRPQSREYLHMLEESKKNENIDFYFIYEAYNSIRNWFKDKINRINDIESVLLNKVKVIWYKVSETENVIDVFTRLNMGKIPLVNAELVKALFLRSSNFDTSDLAIAHLQQLAIAQEWDTIEKQLQDDDFWYFLSNSPEASNRIEFVLALASMHLSNEGIIESDKLKVFLQFNRQLAKSQGTVNIAKEWLNIKQCFMTLEEWYKDKTLFHLIGYLVSQGKAIDMIFNLSKECKSKRIFRQKLIELIAELTFPNYPFNNLTPSIIDDDLSALSYENDATRIKQLLLLFNIASLLANPVSNARFQFDKFKLNSWDIEHIRSVASDMPRDKSKQKTWLTNVIEYISDDNTLNAKERKNEDADTAIKIKYDASELLQSTNFGDEQFESIYKRILALYDPITDEGVDHSIGNLTLLDSSTNRGNQNVIFPIKRAKIIALDKKAAFVPLCTKNVFLKYYSKQVDKMLFWATKDTEDHQQALCKSLYDLFNGKGLYL